VFPQVLLGVGHRSKSILKLKNLKIYAFGLCKSRNREDHGAITVLLAIIGRLTMEVSWRASDGHAPGGFSSTFRVVSDHMSLEDRTWPDTWLIFPQAIRQV
jgi:hypothetical protein